MGDFEESEVPMQDAIRAYLDRIAESKFLGRSTRRSALIEYLLRLEAANEGEKIKAYSIGIDVFGKSTDFDTTTDSSVRVEVGRLRTAIALFEASEWADTEIKVEIPVGTYRPVITQRQSGITVAAQIGTGEGAAIKTPPAQGRSRNLAVSFVLGLAGVVLFAGLIAYVWRGTPTESGPPISLTVEDLQGGPLGTELSLLVKDSFSNNSIVELLALSPEKAREGHYVVRGRISKIADLSYVSVELENQGTQKIVWSHFFELDGVASIQEQLDIKLNGELETRLIGEAKVLLEQRDVNTLTPEQLFILGTWVSGPAKNSLEWEVGRVDLMKLALEKGPDFGPAHSVLADKYGFLANMHPDWDTQETLQLSRFHAERASELSPLDSNAMFNVAQSYWHAGRHKDSQRIFQRVLELDSGNSLARFFARVVPYWCAAVPDDVMEWALDYDARLSSDNPIRWIVLTWIATLHTNRQEHGLALRAATDAAQIFQVGYTYMARAMLLNKAGQPDAARAVINRQMSNWPGTTARHYATSTIPRLCTEQPDAANFIKDYTDLAEALAKDL